MLTRSNSSLTTLSAKSQTNSLTLHRLFVNRVSGILLLLLLATSFVTVAKVLLSPLMPPVPTNYPEPTSKEIKALNPSSANCVSTALIVCISE